MTKEIVLLIGAPLSGKSEVAKIIGANLDFHIVSTNELFEEHKNGPPKQRIKQKRRKIEQIKPW